MRECFVPKDFTSATLRVIHQANQIIGIYREQGFNLTLRQLYYQFVAEALIPNTMQSYKRLGSIINDGRLAGLIDWDAIEDRTRELNRIRHWNDPQNIMKIVADTYQIDKWRNQDARIEVWIEKEALIGVIEPICEELRIDSFACRGYVSQSEQYRAAKRHAKYIDDRQSVVILHFGDHDPSGIDMTRDNAARLEMFSYCDDITVRRLALNMDQIEDYNPPPNPAKMTDSRAHEYVTRFGYESWELDALKPTVLAGLIRDAVLEYRNEDAWAEMTLREDEEKALLVGVHDRWDDIVDFLTDGDDGEASDD